MANKKEYGYQIKGSKLSLVEKDFTTTDGLNYVYSGTSGDGITDNIPSGSTVYKSPLTTIADGLEIEYVHIPDYRINDIDDVSTVLNSVIGNDDGFLSLVDSTTTLDFTTLGLAVNDYILLRNAGKWNGLHKISALRTGVIDTTTPNSKASNVAFEETVNMYYNINVLNDENDDIDLPRYLAQALVYYVRARLAEDTMNIEVKEYFMKEFRKMVEKHENAKVAGPRLAMPGRHAIR